MNIDSHFLNKLQSGEHELFKLIATTFTEGSIIDVGAHHGIVTEVFLAEGWQAYAFEPIGENLEKMQQRIGNQPKLVLFPEAVSNSSGYKTLNLALNSDDSLHEFYHSLEKIGEDNYHKKGEGISVKTISLDDLIVQQRIPQKIEFLKIDTEGHDLAVLQGASRLECQVISVEFWCDNHPLGKSPSPPEKMVELLQNQGFERYIIIERKDAYKTSYLYSSLLNLESNSWGNIFFFNSSQNHLYQRAVNLCEKLESHHKSQQMLASMAKLLTRFYDKTDPVIIADVGAYRGDFTGELIDYFPQAKAILFEPSPVSFLSLVEKYTEYPSIQIFNFALSNYESIETFYVLDDAATNSLLFPLNQDPSEVKVQVKTLDKLWQEIQPFDRLDILKIDTQGNDLKVLQGSQNVIEKYSPCLLIEAIFVGLYHSQNSYYELLQFMQDHDYHLIGIYNTHCSELGQLAFADLLFVPKTKLEQFLICPTDKFICYDLEYLVNQNQLLQKACDERLALINTLNQVAEERLNLINVLDSEIKRLQLELKQLLEES